MVWSPHAVKDMNLLEAVQRHAAQWVCGSRWNQTTHSWSIPHDVCYRKLCLPSLSARRDYLSVCALQDIRHAGSIKFQTIVHTTLCLLVAIILPSYPHLHQSMLDDTLILSMFALCGTKYQSVFWELRAVLFLAMLFTDISVVIFKCNLLLLICCFVDVMIIVVDLFCFVSVILCVFCLVVVCVLY